MPRYELDLRLDAPADDRLASAFSPASERARAAVYARLKLKPHSNAWVRIDVGTAPGGRTLEQLHEACRSGEVVAGSGTLTEILDPADAEAAAWYLLVTRTADHSFSLWDDYPSYRAGSLPPGHALNHTFVSADFVDACDKSKLRGISFLRCLDRGRKRGKAWFAALPAQALGRGLDHPWFDRAAWLREVGADPRKRASAPDTGQNTFHQRWLKAGAGAALLGPLLELFGPHAEHDSTLTGLSFVTVPRYWTDALPDADFAYVPWGEDGPNREGEMMRFRQLMSSRRARDVLLAAGLFDDRAFLGVRAVRETEVGVENLDRRLGPVPPMFAPEELAALRLREQRLFPG